MFSENIQSYLIDTITELNSAQDFIVSEQSDGTYLITINKADETLAYELVVKCAQQLDRDEEHIITMNGLNFLSKVVNYEGRTLYVKLTGQ